MQAQTQLWFEMYATENFHIFINLICRVHTLELCCNCWLKKHSLGYILVFDLVHSFGFKVCYLKISLFIPIQSFKNNWKLRIVKFSFFWEGHIKWSHLPIALTNQLADLLSKCQNEWKITPKFCGLLRKAELYYPTWNSYSKRSYFIRKLEPSLFKMMATYILHTRVNIFSGVLILTFRLISRGI